MQVNRNPPKSYIICQILLQQIFVIPIFLFAGVEFTYPNSLFAIFLGVISGNSFNILLEGHADRRSIESYIPGIPLSHPCISWCWLPAGRIFDPEALSRWIFPDLQRPNDIL
jgi:hypothetical protein